MLTTVHRSTHGPVVLCDTCPAVTPAPAGTRHGSLAPTHTCPARPQEVTR